MPDFQKQLIFFFWLLFFKSVVLAGPYTEMGINGYIDPNGRGADPISEPNAVLNPIFRGWATGFENYLPADTEWTGDWNDPGKALGPVTGDNFDIVSLGELDEGEIAEGYPPGKITFIFGDPCNPDDANHIRDVNGYDFAVFENGFLSNYTAGGYVRGQMLAELGYVEVSSNGFDFVRFPCVSLTTEPVGGYGTIEISYVFNLAGKHPNAYGICTGTPFDLSELAGHPLVSGGVVDINNISYVRIVDIPGSGDFYDFATGQIDPCSLPLWENYDANHPIYDAWVTTGSGGIDIEAVGVMKEQNYRADIDLNGVVNLGDFALMTPAWNSRFGKKNWIERCDLSEPKDLYIDINDLAIFNEQWLKTEQWHSN